MDGMIPIAHQIAEATAWVTEAQRDAAKPGKGQELARLRLERSRALLTTLEWCRDNSELIRAVKIAEEEKNAMTEYLKCDAKDCDHHEDVTEITAEMIGKPCPLCGANLLTADDFEMYRNVLKPAMNLMTALGLSRPASPDDPAEELVRVGGHKGSITITPHVSK